MSESAANSRPAAPPLEGAALLRRRLMLADDVKLTPVIALPAPVRMALSCDDGSYVVTRKDGRAPSRLLGAQTMQLVESFRTPCLVADAIASQLKIAGPDSAEYLTRALPILDRLAAAGILVPPGSSLAKRTQRTLRRGMRVAGFRVERCLKALWDSEVYRVRCADRGDGVLKLFKLQPEGERAARREAGALAALAGVSCVPRSFALTSAAGHDCLINEWVDGDEVLTVAAELRTLADGRREADLLVLAGKILDAFASLHARGVIHGDVHPRNVLVRPDGSVAIIDFGSAEGVAIGGHPGRAGVIYFLEPELAVIPRDKAACPATETGEQYSLAALLYLVFTGSHYLEFAAAADTARRQIVHDAPRPFTSCGVPAWSSLESVLARALSKQPRDRFASVADFAAALRSVTSPGRPSPRSARLSRLRDVTLSRARFESPPSADDLLDESKRAARTGAAGIAYAMLQLSIAENDGELLAWAAVWAACAADAARRDTRRARARSILLDGAPGIHLIAAQISFACSNPAEQHHSTAAFLDACRPRSRWWLERHAAEALIASAVLLDIALRLPARLNRRLRKNAETFSRFVGSLEQTPMTRLAVSRWSAFARGERSNERASLEADAYRMLSPGALGNAHALLRLYRATGDETFRDAAERAMDDLLGDEDHVHSLGSADALNAIVLGAFLERPYLARVPLTECTVV